MKVPIEVSLITMVPCKLPTEVGRARWRSDIADKTTGVFSARRGSWGEKQADCTTKVGKYAVSQVCVGCLISTLYDRELKLPFWTLWRT